MNIYGNCIKYTRPGGKITTIVETVPAEEGRCAYRWTITDTGVGMSEEFLQRIFEPFAQERSDARSVSIRAPARGWPSSRAWWKR